MEVYQNRFNMTHAAFSTPDGKLHRLRRAAINPFFSTSRVQGHGPYIQSVADKVCVHLKEEYVGKAKELTLNNMYSCFSGDIVIKLAFGYSRNLIDAPDFAHPFTKATTQIASLIHVATHFPWIPVLINSINEDLLMFLMPYMRSGILVRRVRSSFHVYYLPDVTVEFCRRL